MSNKARAWLEVAANIAVVVCCGALLWQFVVVPRMSGQRSAASPRESADQMTAALVGRGLALPDAPFSLWLLGRTPRVV